MASIDNNQNEELKPESALENVNQPETVKPSVEEELHDDIDHEEHTEDYANWSLEDIAKEAEKIVNSESAGAQSKKFGLLKEAFQNNLDEEQKDKKAAYVADGGDAENFDYQPGVKSKFNALVHIFKEKQDDYHKKLEKEHAGNLEKRREIIDNLKNLYTNSEVGTNLFKAIRGIKEEWQNAGQVAKSDFKNLSNDYFFHLNQFYQMLDLNKEYREQEYAHNLEKRRQIIARTKELKDEPVVQKALNELQYLHKLWREEAEPVAEEFRDSTWEEFKEVSAVIHERRAELMEKIEKEQEEVLVKKNQIIAEIQKLTNPEKKQAHSYWQNAMKKVEDLRHEFIGLGNVPKKVSNQNWTDFKETLRAFNSAKNDFYKNIKKFQHENLDKKMQLVQTAKDNMDSEDWETTVPLFKKLQDEWKAVGHVPKSHTERVWSEFRDACNHFFDKFREKGNVKSDDWRVNYKNKKALLDELTALDDEADNSVDEINRIRTEWNNIGKVPRDKMSINAEFNKLLRSKMKNHRGADFSAGEEGLSPAQVTDKARKVKNQIADLQAEIVVLENNLAFFSNPSRENPLLKDTFVKLDAKKLELEDLKATLHHMIVGQEQAKSQPSSTPEE